ncbi:MAG: hypothetical protein ACFFA3_17610 [Promethearchaeota archaeon]
MIKNKTLPGCLILLCFILSSFLGFLFLNQEYNYKELNNLEQINTSAQESYFKQWIENPDFTSTENWTSINGLLGDPDDLNAYIDTSAEEANFEVIGEVRTKTIDDPINIANSGNWVKFNKTEPAINPDTCTIDNNGFYVSHSWHDATADQFASVYWRFNVSMDVDMSEYEITSAFLNAIMYANVDPNIDTKYDTYARFSPDYPINQPGIFDHAFFIVEIADLDMKSTYRIAYNQTNDLGKDTVPTIYTVGPKSIEPEGDQLDLIYYLNRVFENDPGHDNFTIIVGIEISCEDDYTSTDFDDWDELRIQSLNLTFTYEKKIDKLSSISWNQQGVKPSDLSNDTVVVNSALLGFKYKINETWPSISPNSEIRINVNDIKHSESIKLSSATSNFQPAKVGGFDIAYLIDEDKNINVSIEVYIADDFKLNRSIKISIDEVYLNISYTIIFDDYQTNLQLFLNGENKTLSPSITLPIDRNLTITIKYTNQTGGHISGATLLLTGGGIFKSLDEHTDNYSITLNVTEDLSYDINNLNIEATKTNYETRIINPTVIVRKINTEFLTVSGETTININEGEDAHFAIMLNDTDNNELIKGAIVTYTWDLDPIQKVLTEDDGVYEGVIVDPPQKLGYIIRIYVFAGGDYEFQDYYELTLNVGTIVPKTQPDLSWVIYTLIGAIAGLVVVFTLYQTHFKYPPMIRKIRKLRKKIGKGKKTKPIMLSERNEIVQKKFQSHKHIIGFEQKTPEKPTEEYKKK